MVLTKDARIRTNALEREALLSAGVAAFMVGSGDVTGPAMARCIRRRFRGSRKGFVVGTPASDSDSASASVSGSEKTTARRLFLVLVLRRSLLSATVAPASFTGCV